MMERGIDRDAQSIGVSSATQYLHCFSSAIFPSSIFHLPSHWFVRTLRARCAEDGSEEIVPDTLIG